MLLYRYFGSHGFETLRDKRLLVSKVSAFNDPFECMYRITGETTVSSAKIWIKSRWDEPEFLRKVIEFMPDLKTYKRAHRHLKNNLDAWAAHFVKNGGAVREGLREIRSTFMDRGMRVASFSGDGVSAADEVLMWSHYSQKHAGTRIAFEFPDAGMRFEIRPMTYQEHRAEFDVSKYPLAPQQVQRMGEILRTKSKAWEYEHEFRLMTLEKFCVKEDSKSGPLEFIEFDPSWVRRVDIGLRQKRPERDRILTLLAAEYPHASAYQAVLHEDIFGLDYMPLQSGRRR